MDHGPLFGSFNSFQCVHDLRVVWPFEAPERETLVDSSRYQLGGCRHGVSLSGAGEQNRFRSFKPCSAQSDARNYHASCLCSFRSVFHGAAVEVGLPLGGAVFDGGCLFHFPIGLGRESIGGPLFDLVKGEPENPIRLSHSINTIG